MRNSTRVSTAVGIVTGSYFQPSLSVEAVKCLQVWDLNTGALNSTIQLSGCPFDIQPMGASQAVAVYERCPRGLRGGVFSVIRLADGHRLSTLRFSALWGWRLEPSAEMLLYAGSMSGPPSTRRGRGAGPDSEVRVWDSSPADASGGPST